MTEKYRPSNGSEGADFMDRFCGRCMKDKAYRDDPDFGDSCPIAASTMAYRLDDPEYPAEWTYSAEGRPTCTAFEAEPE